ncbi:MAG: patatin-like phospholipase family protein [Dehalococcoidia bacterium]
MGEGSFFAKLGSLGERIQATRAEIGAMALAARTPGEARRLELIASRLGFDQWPQKRLVVTAVDAQTGAFVTWDKDSGVRLAAAIASSSAVPGMYPPVTINGRRYIDGGIYSATCAEIARGYETVLIVAPLGASRDGLGGFARRTLDAEAEALRKDGSTVNVIQPDAEALEAFGPNLMGPSRRQQAAEAGVRQGEALAERLRGVWS